MVDVFISYKAEDRRRVAPLVRALEVDGLSVWWDAHIGGGVDWRDTLEGNLARAAPGRSQSQPAPSASTAAPPAAITVRRSIPVLSRNERWAGCSPHRIARTALSSAW